jgi:hypothetical protein
MIAQFRRLVAALLIASFVFPVPGYAGLVPTDAALSGARERVSDFLGRSEVQVQLQAYGVKASELAGRVSALSDAEAAELAARIDELPAGGVSILGVILIVFLVLLLTDILGYTKVFPFTRSMK